MLFSFPLYITQLQSTDRRNNLANSYINQVEDFTMIKDFRETKPYRDYVSRFPAFEYQLPVGEEYCDQWKQFLQLLLSNPSVLVKCVATDDTRIPRIEFKVKGYVEDELQEIRQFIDQLSERQVDQIFGLLLDELFAGEVSLASDPFFSFFTRKERETLRLKHENFGCEFRAIKLKKVEDVPLTFLHRQVDSVGNQQIFNVFKQILSGSKKENY